GPPVSRARWSDVEEGAELLGEDGIWTNAAVEEGGDKEKESFWTSPDGFRHLLVTAVFLGLSYAIAMTLDDLGVILEELQDRVKAEMDCSANLRSATGSC
ncbi:unnamed protein product, partial [Ascophyllum nodosum]